MTQNQYVKIVDKLNNIQDAVEELAEENESLSNRMDNYCKFTQYIGVSIGIAIVLAGIAIVLS